MRRAPGIRLLLAAVAALFLASSLASAQANGTAVDYSDWENLAGRVEQALETGSVSTVVLEELRADLAVRREAFLAAQDANHSRIETLREQIAALGPPPEEGAAPEAEEVAARRRELEERLAQLEAPGRTAEEAYTRADGLIDEIDTVIREREADQLLQLGPSPLNPVLWAPAFAAISETGTSIVQEIQRNWQAPIRRANMREVLPAILVLTVFAIAFLSRGRQIMQRLTHVALRRRRREGRDVLVFLVSFGQVVLPVLGLFLALSAALATTMPGPKGTELLGELPLMGLAIFGGLWLSVRVFPATDEEGALLQFSADDRAEGRWYVVTLGFLVAVTVLLEEVALFPEHTIESMTVLSFPLVVISGFVLFRVGQFLIRADPAGGAPSPAAGEDEGETAETESDDRSGEALIFVVRLLGRALILVGIAGPILAAVGYFRAAEALMFPTVLSLALAAFLAVLHIPIRDTYAVLAKVDDQTAREALVPVLVSSLLVLASIPVFALIWGARVVELIEVWERFRAGISIGDVNISPANFLRFILVFAIGYAITRATQGFLRGTVLPKTKMDVGGRTAVVSGLGYVGIFVAAVAAISAAGIDLSSIAIVAGALSVGIGFGLQNIVQNFISGIILLVERPIGEGDWIEVGGQMGIVKDISVRSTRIETFDRTDVIVPNAEFISGQVTNWTRGNQVGRVIVSVGVAYNSDSTKVEQILRELCENHPLVETVPPPAVYFRRFGADALEFDCMCILRDVKFKLVVHSELNHQIHARFREEGIEIPFAQRDVWLRNPETLPGATVKGSNASDANARRPDQPDVPDEASEGEN